MQMGFIHDPAIYEDRDTGKYYIYCTGAVAYVSDDLVEFRELGRVIDGVPEDSRSHTGSEQICSIQGKWTRTREDRLLFCYGPHTEEVHIEWGYDAENEKETLLLSGLTGEGICTWAKRI